MLLQERRTEKQGLYYASAPQILCVGVAEWESAGCQTGLACRCTVMRRTRERLGPSTCSYPDLLDAGPICAQGRQAKTIVNVSGTILRVIYFWSHRVRVGSDHLVPWHGVNSGVLIVALINRGKGLFGSREPKEPLVEGDKANTPENRYTPHAHRIFSDTARVKKATVLIKPVGLTFRLPFSGVIAQISVGLSARQRAAASHAYIWRRFEICS